MSKVLEIVGASRKLIIDDCAKCPLQYRISGYREECHHPDLEGRFAESGCICYLCPLPDAPEAPADVWPDDENHRLGPNGERLVAEREYCSCSGCFYDGKKGVCRGVLCRDVECDEKIWVRAQ